MGICCDVAHVSEWHIYLCMSPEWHIYLCMSVYVSDLSLKKTSEVFRDEDKTCML